MRTGPTGRAADSPYGGGGLAGICGSSRFCAVWVVCKCPKLFRCEELWGVSVVGSNPTTPTSQAG